MTRDSTIALCCILLESVLSIVKLLLSQHRFQHLRSMPTHLTHSSLNLDTALSLSDSISHAPLCPADQISPRRLVAPALPHLEALRLCRALCVGAQPQLEEHDVCRCVDVGQCARGGDHLGTGALAGAFFSLSAWCFPRHCCVPFVVLIGRALLVLSEPLGHPTAGDHSEGRPLQFPAPDPLFILNTLHTSYSTEPSNR